MQKPHVKLSGLSVEQSAKLMPPNPILVGYRGSIAHRMYVPSSDPNSIDDKDVMAIFVAPVEHYIGFGRKDVMEHLPNAEKGDPWDIVSYELKKYVSLLLNCNPNVMSLLWMKEEKNYIYVNPAGQRLIDNRHLFASKAAYHSFTGYAHAQLKKMVSYKHEGYMGAKRKSLVERFGYDTKNAAHLIRLLRMGIEFLTEGELHVEREDAAQLLSIKRGEWSLEKVKDEAEQLFKMSQEAYVRSPLPPKPDREAAEKLVVSILRSYVAEVS